MKILKNNQALLISAVDAPELIKALLEKLQAGVAHFVFKKKDGTTREAYGTNHPDWYIAVNGENTRPDWESEEHMRKKTPGITHYYDLEVVGWRSFITDNLIVVY